MLVQHTELAMSDLQNVALFDALKPGELVAKHSTAGAK
jgi:hypothetical protein